MSNSKVLTVSVAAYNVEKYIEECLTPFTKIQHGEKCEVLIINDGSTDRTPEIANEFVSKYPNIFKLINKENGGYGSTVNTSIKLATGKYFKLLDGDDYFDEEYLDDFIEFLENTDADFIHSTMALFHHETKEQALRHIVIKARTTFPIEQFCSKYEYEPGMWCAATKTHILRDNHIEITPKCMYTDTEYVWKAFVHSKTISFYECIVYMHRNGHSSQSISTEGFIKYYKDHILMLHKLIELEHIIQDMSVLRIFYTDLRRLICYQYNRFALLEPTIEHKTDFQEFERWLQLEYAELYAKIYEYPKRIECLYKYGIRNYISDENSPIKETTFQQEQTQPQKITFKQRFNFLLNQYKERNKNKQ